MAAPQPVEQEVRDDEMEQELAEAAKADPMAGRHLTDVCPAAGCMHAASIDC